MLCTIALYISRSNMLKLQHRLKLAHMGKQGRQRVSAAPVDVDRPGVCQAFLCHAPHLGCHVSQCSCKPTLLGTFAVYMYMGTASLRMKCRKGRSS